MLFTVFYSLMIGITAYLFFHVLKYVFNRLKLGIMRFFSLKNVIKNKFNLSIDTKVLILT